MIKEEIGQKLDVIISSAVGHHDYVFSAELEASDVDKWDSLANAMIITSINDTFGIKMKFFEIAGWSNIGELVDIIYNKLA